MPADATVEARADGPGSAALPRSAALLGAPLPAAPPRSPLLAPLARPVPMPRAPEAAPRSVPSPGPTLGSIPVARPAVAAAPVAAAPVVVAAPAEAAIETVGPSTSDQALATAGVIARRLLLRTWLIAQALVIGIAIVVVLGIVSSALSQAGAPAPAASSEAGGLIGEAVSIDDRLYQVEPGGGATFTGGEGAYRWTALAFVVDEVVIDWTATAPTSTRCTVAWAIEPVVGDPIRGTISVEPGGIDTGSRVDPTPYADAAFAVESTCEDWAVSIDG